MIEQLTRCEDILQVKLFEIKTLGLINNFFALS